MGSMLYFYTKLHITTVSTQPLAHIHIVQRERERERERERGGNGETEGESLKADNQQQ